MDFGLFTLLVALAFGTICYKMAEHRGRSTVAGFIYGFLFGLIAVICYALVGDSEEKRAERAADLLAMQGTRTVSYRDGSK